jgi:hypothetical protein
MFSWGRKGDVEKRAKLLARMIALIMHGIPRTSRHTSTSPIHTSTTRTKG